MYSIDIISHGYTVDAKTNAHQHYLIETWTFRVDSAGLQDWMKSRPLDLYDLMPDETPVSVIEEAQSTRTQNRQFWCQRVLRALLGRHVELDECEMYNITNVVTEVFAAARITKMHVDEPTIRLTNKQKLHRELEALDAKTLEGLLEGNRLIRRLDELHCRECCRMHQGCPGDCEDGGDCIEPSIVEWLDQETDYDVQIIPKDVSQP